jgi:hypothetical protein
MTRKMFRAAVVLFVSIAVGLCTASPSSAASATGTVYDDIRYTNGNWQGWQAPSQPSGTMYLAPVANAGMPDGSMHVLVDTSTGLFDNIRYANGTWQGWAQPAQPPGGGVQLVAAAGMPNGQLHVDVVGGNGVLYDNIRYINGVWRGWNLVSGANNKSTIVRAAGMPDGQLQVVLIIMDTGGVRTLYHNILYTTGVWQGWAQPSRPGGIFNDVAITAMTNDTLHLDTASYQPS